MKSVCQSVTILTLIACISCRPSISHDEVGRVSSPDGRIDAVLFETNGGATTSFSYEVEVSTKPSRRGTQVAHLYGAIRSPQAYGIDLHWENDHTLVIECLDTKTPPEISHSIAVSGRDMQVLVRTGVEDKSAPAGGMLYNLHKQ